MTRRKTDRPRLTGELAKKTHWTGPKVPASDASRLPPEERERWEQAHRSVVEQRRKKLLLLAQRYGIPLDDEKFIPKLLIAVCDDFIPGFRDDRPEPKQKGGRPRKWDFQRCAKLIKDVEAVQKTKNCKQRPALRELVRTRTEYRSGKAHETIEKAVDTLEARLLEAKKMWGPLVPMLEDFIEFRHENLP